MQKQPVSTSPFPLWARVDFLSHQHLSKCPHHWEHPPQHSSRALHTVTINCIGRKGSGEAASIARQSCLHLQSPTPTPTQTHRLSPAAFRLHIRRRRRILDNGKISIVQRRRQPSQLGQKGKRISHCEGDTGSCLELLHRQGTSQSTSTVGLVFVVGQRRRRYLNIVKEAVSAVAPDKSSRRLHPRRQQPTPRPSYPGANTPTPPIASPIPVPLPVPEPARVARSGSLRRNNSFRRAYASAQRSFLQAPFRTRGATAALNADPFQRPLQRIPAARLWNPTNFTPRSPDPSASARRRRPSTPPPPAVPLTLPTLDLTIDSADLTGVGAGDYPLLTFPEQYQGCLSVSNRASLQIERSAGSEQRVNLPRSVRHSYDEKRLSITPSPAEEPEAGPSLLRAELGNKQPPSPVGLSFEPAITGEQERRTRLDKGKGKATMTPRANESEDDRGGFSHDLERGRDSTNHPRYSTASRVSGIGSAITSSDDSSIMGDPDQQPDTGEEWGPQHPCYPHLNPHVPVDSPEYVNTRIIRVRRDWLIEGDLAPTFSNLYPEILDPAGVTEQEFRRVIEKLNGELIPIFSPYNWRNILDGMLGVATGWLWEDFGLTGVKSRLKKLEKWIEQWNLDMEKSLGHVEGVVPPKIVPLRRTGYMTLDIQIPDPEIAPAPPSTPGASRSGPIMPTEPPTAVVI